MNTITSFDEKGINSFYSHYFFEYAEVLPDEAICGLYGRTCEADVADWLRAQNLETA